MTVIPWAWCCSVTFSNVMNVYTLSTSLMGKQLTESSNTLVWRHLNKSEDWAWRNLARFNMEKWEVLFHCAELPCADWEVTGCEIRRIELGCYRWCQAEGANMLLLGINRAVHLAEFWGDGPQSKKLCLLYLSLARSLRKISFNLRPWHSKHT